MLPTAENSPRRGQLLPSLNAVFVSLNIACAFGYAACLYIGRSMVGDTWQDDSGYYFLRGAVRVSDLLHQAIASPVLVSAVARRDSIIWSAGTIAMTVAATIWSAAAAIFLLIRFLGSRLGSAEFLRRISEPIALFLTPALCVAVWLITWKWEWSFSAVHTPFGHYVLICILCGELFSFVIMSQLSFQTAFSRGASAILLLLHFAFWAFVLFPNFIPYIGESKARLLIHVTTWFIPAAGSAFLLYVWPGDRSEVSTGYSFGRWPVIAAMAGLAILFAIWMPSWHRGSMPSAIGSTTIELSRGPCFGSCAAYTVTIHDDGNVEFDGKQLTKVHGKQTGQITDAQFAQILDILNRVRFADLDDRAFNWCFDTPTVSLTVRTNGHEKNVSSDAACVGAKAGLQAGFVNATTEIENILSTDRWVQCEGHYCR